MQRIIYINILNVKISNKNIWATTANNFEWQLPLSFIRYQTRSAVECANRVD